MSINTSVYFNKQRIKKDGTATVYIRITINREKEFINMKFDWPVSLIDTASNIILPRYKGDIEHADYQIIINKELSKINEIARIARLSNKELSIADIKHQLQNFASRDSFTAYFEHKLKERITSGKIRKATHDSQKSSLNSLILFRKNINFNEISLQLIEDYKTFMYVKLRYDSDTAHTKLKDLRTYLNQAIKDGYHFTYPFAGFKMPKENRRLEFLNEADFQKLKQFFESGQLTEDTNKHKSLRCYLFMCYTGIRLGDFQKLEHSHIRHNILSFKPNKATADNQKIVEIPLHPEAKKLIVTKKGKLFDFPSSESKMREMLSEIAQSLGINSTCSPHSARHTFATRFLASGGRIEVLQQLLGHEDIKSTLIYVHVDLDRKKKEINLMA